jgi:hypothetical protein
MSGIVRNISLRALMLGMAVLLGIAAGAPVAQAGTGGGGLPCSGQQLSQPFTPWGDFSNYYLVPGGSFEPGSRAWATTGGAKVGAGNEPWHVGGAGVDSLALPAGGSATSPQTCVSLGSPTLRFFAHSSGTSLLSSLRIGVVFATTAGILHTLPIGAVLPSSTWRPTSPYVFLANLLTPLGPNYRMVAFQFTPQGRGSWQIDDVYVDPWSKG